MSNPLLFDAAMQWVKKIKCNPTDQLELYGLYQQATVGDAPPESRPGLFDVQGRAKYDAWNSFKSLSSQDAKSKYIDKVARLLESMETTPEILKFFRDYQ